MVKRHEIPKILIGPHLYCTLALTFIRGKKK
jgi:hypothetical protein